MLKTELREVVKTVVAEHEVEDNSIVADLVDRISEEFAEDVYDDEEEEASEDEEE